MWRWAIYGMYTLKRGFMKMLFVIVMSFVAQVSSAQCLGEAQIIAKIKSTSKTLTSCVAYLDQVSIVQYNVNRLCPLDIGDVYQTGIEVGLIHGHDCLLEAGAGISGILVKKQSGKIALE